DMDGTLLDGQSQISHRNIKAIHQLAEHGIEFAIASGRDYEGVYSLIHPFDIKCEAILGNGAQYVDRDGNVILSCYMNKDVFKDVISIFEKANIPFMVFTTDGFYTTQEPTYVRDSFITRNIKKFNIPKEDYIKGGKREFVPSNLLQKINNVDEFLKRDLEIIKVEAFSLNPEEIIVAKDKLVPIQTISFLSSFNDNVEVTNEYAQKGLILEKVIEIKGIKKEEVVVIGDGMNDITLFKCFDNSYAPSNAEEEIKNLASLIVSDCEEDAVADVIEVILNGLGN
ncbi:MAG: HAD family hydrolase, partial [Coprobacillus sp.]